MSKHRPHLSFAVTGIVTLLAASPTFAQTTANLQGDDELSTSSTLCGPQATVVQGQRRIDQGRYEAAKAIFTCLVDADPTALDGYRGRAEASLLQGHYADAMADYARVNAFVFPSHPDTVDTVFASYDARLSHHPNDIAALTGASFVHWWFFDYEAALPFLDHLLTLRPNDLYGTLYRGSNRLFVGADVPGGMADFEQALTLAPASADVRFIVSDGYTYAYPDPDRAFAEATLALAWGLDTPRIHAILASALFAQGDVDAAAYHLQTHIAQVTTESVATAPLASGGATAIDLGPGRTFDIPLAIQAGELVAIRTASPSEEIYDSIAVLLAPDGSAVVGNDDFDDYLAGFDWIATATGTYTLRVTSFEGVSSGALVVMRN